MKTTASTKPNRRAMAWTIAASLLLSWTAAQAAGLQSGPVSDDPIWTDKPVRIDRKTQGYERVKVERKILPLTLKPTTRVTVFDSSSFQEGGDLYVLADAVAVNPKRLCRGDDGHIAACGQQARLFLKRLITNHTLTCQDRFRAGQAVFVSCRAEDKDLAETLVSKGAAWAATPRLAAAQQQAMTRKAGIWIDTECRAVGHCPRQDRR
ncbi:thermonuclease family protein [Shinella kummerowiae]|uniref:thermonuclease family protein n=1 Tax=Shinella kummerowiae TaxID=417745 RepID=UPI0021B5AAF3|nr:thermonuclease family protein [Shinella kummerowiae]MCT7666350.1 hypothetical protein [Shinella kummerowiae]